MMEAANPAARLFNLFALAAQENTNASIRVVWSKVFGIDKEDHVEFLLRYSRLVHLTDEIEDAVLASETMKNQEIYLKPVRALRAAFVPLQLDSAYQDTLSRIGPHVIPLLEVIGDQLGDGREQPIPEADLTKLLDEIKGLHKLIFEDDALDHELQLVLLRLLQKMERAIVNYKILGAEGIRDVLNECIGATYTNQVAKRTTPETFGKWVKGLKLASDIVGLAFKLKELAAPYVDALLGLPHP